MATDERTANPGDLVVDSAFPGGNIVVDGIEGDHIRVHQDLRDTAYEWFYWYLRVRGAEGRALTVEFTVPRVIGVHGPAASTDGGRTWRWLGAQAVAGRSFRYTCPAGVPAVRFSVTMPYVEADIHAFLGRYGGDSCLRLETLCLSEKGRPVEMLRIGKPGGRVAHRVLITARHHACESMASYVLEGLIAAILTDHAVAGGQWDGTEVLVIPFMDKDGVEDGDQGKGRSPHDHNDDYGEPSRYAAVRALKTLVPAWSEGLLRVALDLHCLGLRGQGHEDIAFVGTPNPCTWRCVEELGRLLEAACSGPLRFELRHNLPFGWDWNTPAEAQGRFDAWAAALPGVRAAALLEVPYANATGQTVTAETARIFGHDVAQALAAFLHA